MQNIIIKKVYHIGTFNIEDRTSHNFEGKGLSVSINPREWLAIARGQISGTPHLLSKDDALFAVMNDEILITVKQWALKKGYLNKNRGYSYTYMDDDIGYEMSKYFETIAEAEEEELEEDDLELISVYDSTQELRDIMKPIKINDINPFQDVFGLYIKENLPEYDGVWFDHVLDPLGLQAPAGMIFDHKVRLWKKEKVNWEELPEKVDTENF